MKSALQSERGLVMGMRGNVFVFSQKANNGVFLYTHDYGLVLPQIVYRAVKRGFSRIDDSAYLARIIFSEMIAENIFDLLGFGISSKLMDYDYPIIMINCDRGIIGIKKGSHRFNYFKDDPDQCFQIDDFVDDRRTLCQFEGAYKS